LGTQIYESIYRFMNLKINKLTSKNWFNSSRSVEDIDEEEDTTAKLK